MKRTFLFIMAILMIVFNLCGCTSSKAPAEGINNPSLNEHSQENTEPAAKGHSREDAEAAAIRCMEAIITSDYNNVMKYSALNVDVFFDALVQSICLNNGISETEALASLEGDFSQRGLSCSIYDAKSMCSAMQAWKRTNRTNLFGEFNIHIEINKTTELFGEDLADFISEMKELSAEPMYSGGDTPRDAIYTDPDSGKAFDWDQIEAVYCIDLSYEISGSTAASDDSINDEELIIVAYYHGQWQAVDGPFGYVFEALEQEV